VIRTHPVKGAELLQSLGRHPIVVRIALEHHERINGTGYPQGLVGKQIHDFSKIVSIADVYDAFCSVRPHQPGQPGGVAMQKMRKQKGLFDPIFLNKLFAKLD